MKHATTIPVECRTCKHGQYLMPALPGYMSCTHPQHGFNHVIWERMKGNCGEGAKHFEPMTSRLAKLMDGTR